MGASKEIPTQSEPGTLTSAPMDSDSATAPATDQNRPSGSGVSHMGRQRKGDSSGQGARGGSKRRADMGRAEWSRKPGNKRDRNDAAQGASKRQKLSDGKFEKPIYAVEFSKEEIENEARRPKRKVAVMIGYSGSGYKGMQLNPKEKTIEGDLFTAFVAAGAVSKANADDPKKSSLVRCARTDKGVHAAGNVISMKLIIEDEDIVKKINENLSPQIRVWGFERTNGSFSAYQKCDSRIYEYLIPTHCFLPPNPNSFLGKKLVEFADEAGDRQGYDDRQEEVATFWANVEEKRIRPILEKLDPAIREQVQEGHYDVFPAEIAAETMTKHQTEENLVPISTEARLEQISLPSTVLEPKKSSITSETKPIPVPREPKEVSPVEAAIREIKTAYIEAKKAYRIHPQRLKRVQSAFSRFVGTHNYYNYTINKTFRDPSAKRVIRSFKVNETPILINNTEWLSLKVHGQSFMMHQIRKMVSMGALLVRCGCPEGRIQDSWGLDKMVIPKAPGLGLLLERPVFDSYNEQMIKGQDERGPISFEKYEKEMEQFKQREIYERIFREEEHDNQFHALYSALDYTSSSQLLYFSSLGFEATKRTSMTDSIVDRGVQTALDNDTSDEDADPEDG